MCVGDVRSHAHVTPADLTTVIVRIRFNTCLLSDLLHFAFVIAFFVRTPQSTGDLTAASWHKANG